LAVIRHEPGPTLTDAHDPKMLEHMMDMTMTDIDGKELHGMAEPPMQPTPHLHDAPVTALYPDWVMSGPARRLSGAVWIQPLVRTDTGQVAHWFLDADGTYRGSHIASVAPDVRAAIMTGLDYILGPIAQFSLVMPMPDYPPPDSVLSHLGLPSVLQLTLAWAPNALGAITVVPPQPPAADPEATRPDYSGEDGLTFSANAIDALLGHAAAHHATGLHAPREMLIASPFGDGIVRTQAIMTVGRTVFHRFFDPRRNTVFYLSVMVAADGTIQSGFYCPLARLIISSDPFAGLLPGVILAWYALNTDHPEMLRAQQPFRPEDFGIGQTSALGVDVTEPGHSEEMQAPAVAASGGDWLPVAPEPSENAPAATESDPAPLLGRFRNWFSRRGH